MFAFERFQTKAYEKVSLSDALAAIFQSSADLTDSCETVLLTESLGRVVGKDVASSRNIPEMPTSIVDGYAVLVDSSSSSRSYHIVGRVLAGGDIYTGELGRDEAVYVATGGILPAHALCVIPMEDCEVIGEELRLINEQRITDGMNVRLPGSDCHFGDNILKRGEVVGPAEVALLTACGIGELSISKKIRISVLSTGAEVVSGSVGDANRAYLLSRLKQSDLSQIVDVTDLGCLVDSKEAFSQVLAQPFDVLITTGSVSKGETDFMKPCLEELGFEVLFGQLDLKPGKPTTVATLRSGKKSTVVFALPGNPASCFVTFNLLALPFIQSLSGMRSFGAEKFQLECVFPERIVPDELRPEFLRAHIFLNPQGRLLAEVAEGHQRSSRVASCANGVNGLVVIPPGRTGQVTAKVFDAYLLPGASIAVRNTPISPTPSISAKAHAFDKLVGWLQNRTDVENIALMDLAGFCRNCLSNWLEQGGVKGGVSEAKRYVYGMDYEEWKKKFRKGEKVMHAEGHAPQVHYSNPCASSLGANAFDFLVLTVSDRAHGGIYEDLSGPLIERLLPKIGGRLVERKIVPDEVEAIQTQIRRWTEGEGVRLIVTTGGTGFSQRDVTREAVHPLIEKEAPGLVHLLLSAFAKLQPHFCLSRPTIGVSGHSLLVTLPGRPEAVDQGLQALLPLIPKVMQDLRIR